MKYQEFYEMMVKALGQTGFTKIPVIPYEQMKTVYENMDSKAKKDGVEHGIHTTISAKLQEEDLYINSDKTIEFLGIRKYNIRKSIKETLKKCVE